MNLISRSIERPDLKSRNQVPSAGAELLGSGFSDSQPLQVRTNNTYPNRYNKICYLILSAQGQRKGLALNPEPRSPALVLGSWVQGFGVRSPLGMGVGLRMTETSNRVSCMILMQNRMNNTYPTALVDVACAGSIERPDLKSRNQVPSAGAGLLGSGFSDSQPLG